MSRAQQTAEGLLAELAGYARRDMGKAKTALGLVIIAEFRDGAEVVS